MATMTRLLSATTPCAGIAKVAAATAVSIVLASCGGSGNPSPTPHSIGVSVSGLSGSGLVLQLNGGNNLSITTNGAATFPGTVNSGTSYTISVSSQPTHPAQTCSVDNGSGTIGAGDVSGIGVSCVTAVTTLYSFTDPNPDGSLVQGNDGDLYGTTSTTAFRITLAGEETKIASMDTGSGGLILANDGNFYATTQGGGEDVAGTVYRLTPTGIATVLTSFAGPDFGDAPPTASAVIQGSDGLLYGFTGGIGIGAAGFMPSIFEMSLAGNIEFNANFPCVVSAPFLQAPDGTIYGICPSGGAYGHGNVFRFSPHFAFQYATIYSFGGGAGDAVGPAVALIEGTDGNLYGTSKSGGASSATCPSGCGTVFKVTPAGVETVLHSFGSNAADGQSPNGALLLASDGSFYGTTSAGGNSNPNCKPQSGCGTVYRITPSGVETVLYSFGTNTGDGVGPSGSLVQASDGNLYGTTGAGGATDQGTFFKLDMGGK